MVSSQRATVLRHAHRAAAPRPRSVAWHSLAVRLLALSYLVLLILIPLAAVAQNGLSGGLSGLWQDIHRPAPWAALQLTLWTAVTMTLINAVMGTLTAYVMVRYRFPGQAFLNAVIDIPFAIPTLVTGVMLVLLYGPTGTLGRWLQGELGWQIIFAPPGIILALLFVSLPFVVRAVQPVLLALEQDQEEAAQTLGATSWTTFWRVVFPTIRPAVLTGSLLAFARALGEFGSIVIVAGNIPMHSQTAAVYVLGQIESENQRGASAMAVVLLAIAFTLIVLVDLVQRRQPGGTHA